MACPFATLAAEPSHPFSSRPVHPLFRPASTPVASASNSSSSGCPNSARNGESSNRPSAAFIPPLSDPPPIEDSVSLLPPHPSASSSATSPGSTRLPDVLPAGPQPLRLSASHPLKPSTAAIHSALHSFRALTSAYAYESYEDAFNWPELELGLDTEGTWYCVAFRSKRMPGTENDLALYEADKAAHEEAFDNGGLLLYWYGRPDVHGVNLATCIWESRAQARLANSRPHHLNAVRLTARSYESYTLERYTLRKVAGEREVRVEPYVEREAGKGSAVALPAIRPAPSVEH